MYNSLFIMRKIHFVKLEKFLQMLYNMSRMRVHEALDLISVDPWKSIKVLSVLYSLNIVSFDFYNDYIYLTDEYRRLLDMISQ